MLLPDRVEADNGRERHSTFGPREYHPGHQSLLTLSARPTLTRRSCSWTTIASDKITECGIHTFLDILSLDVKLLALLVRIQLPPKLRDDLTIDMPLVPVNLLVSDRPVLRVKMNIPSSQQHSNL